MHVLGVGQDLIPLYGFEGALTDWIVVALMLFFGFGVLRYLVTFRRVGRTLKREIEAPRTTLEEVLVAAKSKNEDLPFILVFVPARDESAVIHNTISRLAELEYPTDRYAILVIADEREEKVDGRSTTADIARNYAEQLNGVLPNPFVYVLEVPEWYSGEFGNSERSFARSTKGRALNYALDYVRQDDRLSQADMLGILDADGRLHPSVLCEVAKRRLVDGSKLLQGPVFQISNFDKVGLVGKAAGIELSVYHLSTLSHQLLSRRKTARFLAGTNYFIDAHLIVSVGGWNENALVEDAELGLRVFLKERVTPEWLPCFELEQTSPSRRIYLRQRQRWSLGHFQLLPMIRRSGLPPLTKLSLRMKILGATLMTPIDAGMPVLGWFALLVGWTSGVPDALDWIMMALVVGSIFVWDFFGRGASKLYPYGPVAANRRELARLRILLALSMPWLMVLQAQPRIVAFYKYLFRDHDADWEKTPRTIEQIVAPAETLAESIGSQAKARVAEGPSTTS